MRVSSSSHPVVPTTGTPAWLGPPDTEESRKERPITQGDQGMCHGAAFKLDSEG